MEKGDRDELTAAAAVHSARSEIVAAVASLAARPLDERAAEQMRRALSRTDSVEVRKALRRLRRHDTDAQGAPVSKPVLTSLPCADPDGAER